MISDIIVALISIVPALLAFLWGMKKLNELHVLINSRLDQLLKGEFARGQKQEKDKQNENISHPNV